MWIAAKSLLESMFFDVRRYDLAKVGRYKFNKKLHFKNRISGHVLAEDVVDLSTGEIIASAGTTVNKALSTDIQNSGVSYVMIQTETRNCKVLSNLMVDMSAYVDFDPRSAGVTEICVLSGSDGILLNNYSGEELKEAVRKNVHSLIPKHITKEDIIRFH